LVAFSAVVHDVNGVHNAFVRKFDLVQAGKVACENDESGCEKEIDDGWIAPGEVASFVSVLDQ
jgi:hypothetical protein